MNQFLSAIPAMFVLLISYHTIRAQAPPLGAANEFVLFTTTGAVGNTGISNITGDVGTNNGGITGFGNVNGNMNNANGITAAAANDLLIAYNQLNSTIPTLFPGILLGNGDTLNAAVYQSPAATTLSGNLILDALGDSNAVFIFLIEGPLSTTFGSAIQLINGAQACNVFWKVEGVVSLASSTFFRGTLIANNAAINMSPDDSLEGRMLSTTGAIQVDGIVAKLPSGCGSPLLSGPAAPALGAAACFALFSGNGGLTNAGITFASGDIGSNVGLTLGYNPLFVNGTVHPIPDVTTSMAAADLVTAYTYLNGLPNDIELLFPAQFGNDLILTPHTYHMGAATSFTGNVYLDARGNSDAVFVIKVNGAFSTSTFSNVILLNGTKAENVYWTVDGAVNIGDYSHFNGTIIANNGAIELSIGDTINGRAMTTTGALNSASVVVTSPVVCFPLPLNWVYFTGKSLEKNVLLEWATTNEVNNKFFTIEKSMDGTAFTNLAVIDAHSSPVQTAYTFTDVMPYNKGYYRISQTDHDGQTLLYKTIQVIHGGNTETVITPFAIGNQISVYKNGKTSGKGRILVYTPDGKKIYEQSVVFTDQAETYTLKIPFHQGLYLVSLISENRMMGNGKIIVK